MVIKNNFKGPCVYCIKNILTNEVYIGSTSRLDKRIEIHKLDLHKNKHHSYLLQESFNKYGEENFLIEILEIVDNKLDLTKREQYYIDSYNSVFNICKNSETSDGVKRRPVTIEKVRKANLGLVHPKWRNDIKSKAQGGENHWTKKKKFTDKARKNMSDAQKKLYENGYVNPRKGKELSKDIVYKCNKDKFVYVSQYDKTGNLIRIYESPCFARDITGISNQSIVNCCQRRSKSAGGFVWLYTNNVTNHINDKNNL
jgi:group I intron endonuclease